MYAKRCMGTAVSNRKFAMDNDDNHNLTDARVSSRFVALYWQRRVAEQFIHWRASEQSLEELCTFSQLVFDTIPMVNSQSGVSEGIAAKLPAVLRSCESLKFCDIEEALAYAALHLHDRAGRVS